MARELPDITTILAQAQKDLLDIKQSQFAGTTNIKVQESYSGNTWDINQNVVLSAAPNNVKALIGYFIADTQPAPFAEIYPIIQLDNVPYNPLTDSRLNYNTDIVSLNKAALLALNLTAEQLSKLSFIYIALVATVTVNVKIKFRVRATDTGFVGGIVSDIT